MSNLDVASFNRKGQVFTAANVSAKSVIAVTTAMTGVILSNPFGSGKKFIVVNGGFSWTTVPGAVHNLGWGMVASVALGPTSLTTIGSGVLAADGSGGAGASFGKAYDAATFVTAPVAVRWFGGAAWGTSVGVSPYQISDEPDGALIVAPGASLCMIALTTTAVGVGSVTWIEVPV